VGTLQKGKDGKMAGEEDKAGRVFVLREQGEILRPESGDPDGTSRCTADKAVKAGSWPSTLLVPAGGRQGVREIPWRDALFKLWPFG
jgi:hypothetical protein